MHIVFLTARYPPDVLGGGEVSTQILAEALVGQGARVTVLCGSPVDADEEAGGVRVLRRRSLHAWWGKPLNEAAVSRAAARAVLSTLGLRIVSAQAGAGAGLSTRPDILHAQEFRSALALSLLDHPRRYVTIRDYAPICGTTNNMWWDGSSCDGCFWPNVLFRCHRVAEASLLRKPFRVAQYKGNLGFRIRAFQRIPRHIYTSAALKSRVEARLHPSPAIRSAVIPNPIDPLWLKDPPSPLPTQPVLCAVGRLETTKGTDVLLAALRLLRHEIPGIHLRLVGGGELPRYSALAQQLGVRNAVTFTGPVPPADVRAHIAASTVVVSPHLWEEPFGRVALEAGACGRPLVASDLGGVRETTTPETAILVAPKDLTGLVGAVRTLLRDRERAARMGQTARAHIEQNFHPSTIARTLRAFYSF